MANDGIVRVGNNGVRPVGTRTRFDPATGVEEVTVYEGEEDALKTEAAAVLNAEGKADVYPHDGPAYRMDVVFPDASVKAADSWERVTEFVQEDFRENPKVISLAGSSAQIALWVFQIRQALAAGQTLQASGVANPTQAQLILYEEMARGVTSHELRRIVLRRRRTIPIGWTTPRIPTAVEEIFTTERLVFLFKIPAGVQAILPATPASAPTYRTWGWKVRQDDSILIPSTRKTQEVMQWTFAAWSTSLLYDLVS